MDAPLPFGSRLALALGSFFRACSDSDYAAKLAALAQRTEQPEPIALPAPPKEPVPAEARPRDLGPALQLLELLQREGRLLDFVQQDITSFPDADVGAAARLVHSGCRRAIEQAVTLESVRSEAEGASVTLQPGFDAVATRPIGDVRGTPPWTGILRHRGWVAAGVQLPEVAEGTRLEVLAAAEVEL